jgi:hypothetical protein
MAPCEEAVQVSDFAVEVVVARRGHGHDAGWNPDLADGGRQFANAFVAADGLAVLNAGVAEFAGDFGVHINAGDDERSEKISLAALVDAEVRFEKFGTLFLFLTKGRLAQNTRFEGEENKILDAFALDDGFRAFFINRYGELRPAREVEHVRPRFELVSLASQNTPEGLCLLACQRCRVGIQRFCGRHPRVLCVIHPSCPDVKKYRSRFQQGTPEMVSRPRPYPALAVESIAVCRSGFRIHAPANDCRRRAAVFSAMDEAISRCRIPRDRT